MSYWVWLARMALFGLMSSALVTSLFRFSSPQHKGQVDRPERKAMAIDIEDVLPSDYNSVRGYTPTSNLPVFPDPSESRLKRSLGGETNTAIGDRPLPNIPKPAAVIPKAVTPAKSQGTVAKDTAKGGKVTTPTPKSSPTKPPQTQAKNVSTQKSAQRPITQGENSPFNLNQSIIRHSQLFASPVTLGMLAIGVAEGNYRVFTENETLYVEQTSLYFGHTDPGNLSWGERVTNYGPCSDQGRSGGNIELAEKMCSQRALDRLPTNLLDLHNAGINPDYALEAVLNTADLYNQASPIHSRRFPQALAIAQQGGLHGLEAIAWARTASFYLNANDELDLDSGQNRASGLLGICSRERRGLTEWDCVYMDQMRRTKAIGSVLDKYFKVYKPQ
ncbi:hypothetical protein [Spirulina sp. 06S082]|uniref:hypothetical protein n=1 Tax=Spirulina sp. 06S082 TaxID=3110248 RepID=UPI002B1F8A81|nr:hypothetical protein [Spirulina sp. 06S082]MEA5470433.1 hypothetical protein [Spirulina sp. 06S082]